MIYYRQLHVVKYKTITKIMLLVDRNTAQFSDVVVKMRSFLNN